jgi:uncharacterized Zn finger protein
MAEYKCPDCGSEKITSERKPVPKSFEKVLMILCANCGCFLGVVNDTSPIKDAIKDIRQTLKTSTGL